jgi:hypothetical protein
MRPAFQFYPGDWQRDAALRSCSVGARGLWIEMICIMHQAEPYGHLVVNGRGIEAETLARMVGASKREVGGWLVELERAGVFSQDDGTIVSRRMVRDEAIRKVRAEGGKLGGNPALKVKPKVGRKVNHTPNLPPTPSSSVLQSSSSPSVKTQGAVAPDWLPAEWAEFKRHRTEKRQSLTPTAERSCIAKLERWRAEGKDIAGIIRHSIEQGYTGLFEPTSRGNGSVGVTSHNIAAGQEWLKREQAKDEHEIN